MTKYNNLSDIPGPDPNNETSLREHIEQIESAKTSYRETLSKIPSLDDNTRSSLIDDFDANADRIGDDTRQRLQVFEQKKEIPPEQT